MSEAVEIRLSDAVRAMRDRGIDSAESLLEYAEPQAILNACAWWDGLKGVRPGLLVKRIKEGGLAEAQASPDGLTEKQRKLARLRAQFAELAHAYLPGAVTEPHAQLLARQPPRDPPALPGREASREPCEGDLVVIAVGDSAIEVRCDGCGEELGYALRVAVAVLPSAPMAIERPEPQTPMVPPPNRPTEPLPSGKPGRLKRPDFEKQLQTGSSERVAA